MRDKEREKKEIKEQEKESTCREGALIERRQQKRMYNYITFPTTIIIIMSKGRNTEVTRASL